MTLIIFELEPDHQCGTFMVPNVGLEIKSVSYLGAQRLRKAILADIYVYPAYIKYRRKFGAKTKTLKTLVSCQGCY